MTGNHAQPGIGEPVNDDVTFVPETVEGVGRLLKARKWDKAAIVWAYCEPGTPSPGTAGKTGTVGNLAVR